MIPGAVRYPPRSVTWRNRVNMPLRTRYMGLLVPLVLILTGVSLLAQEVKTTVDPNQDFSKYKKYAWRKTSLANAMIPDEVQRTMQLIKNAGNRELAQKGYWEDAENPDFFVEVSSIGIQDANLAGNVGTLYRYDGYGAINPQYSAAPGTTVWLTLTSQGSIVVTDRATNATVWQAQTLKKYKKPDKAMKNLEQEINSVMKKALNSFPARPIGK
jgi:hypothetical protein